MYIVSSLGINTVNSIQFRKFVFVCHLCAVDLLCAVLLMPLGIVSSSPYFASVVFTVLECQVYVFLNVFLIAGTVQGTDRILVKSSALGLDSGKGAILDTWPLINQWVYCYVFYVHLFFTVSSVSFYHFPLIFVLCVAIYKV